MNSSRNWIIIDIFTVFNGFRVVLASKGNSLSLWNNSMRGLPHREVFAKRAVKFVKASSPVQVTFNSLPCILSLLSLYCKIYIFNTFYAWCWWVFLNFLSCFILFDDCLWSLIFRIVSCSSKLVIFLVIGIWETLNYKTISIIYFVSLILWSICFLIIIERSDWKSWRVLLNIFIFLIKFTDSLCAWSTSPLQLLHFCDRLALFLSLSFKHIFEEFSLVLGLSFSGQISWLLIFLLFRLSRYSGS